MNETEQTFSSALPTQDAAAALNSGRGAVERTRDSSSRQWKHWNFLNFESIVLADYPMATHSSGLSWKIPWTEDPGRIQSMG